MVAPDTHRLADEVAARRLRLGQAVRQDLALKRTHVERAAARIERLAPSRRLPELRQGLDSRAGLLRAALLQELSLKRRDLQRSSSRLTLLAPERRLPVERLELGGRRARLQAAWLTQARARRARTAAARGRLEALSPERVLERGFSITLDAESGRIVDRPAAAPVGTRLRTRVAGGALLSTVDAHEQGSPPGGERLYDG
ncbi:MAG: hypothetical protein NVSMB29_01810 [Candidatus Dormibacteria bacterium]